MLTIPPKNKEPESPRKILLLDLKLKYNKGTKDPIKIIEMIKNQFEIRQNIQIKSGILILQRQLNHQFRQ